MSNFTISKKNGLLRRKKSLEARKARAGWFFVLPFVLGLILVYFPIILDSIWFSFNMIVSTKGGGYRLDPVGFQHYSNALFQDVGYVKSLVSGLQQLVLEIPAIVIFALFIAVVLNQKMLGRAAFRVIFFVPVILSTGLMETINATDTLTDAMGDGSGISTGAGTSASAEIVSAVDIEKLFSSMAIGTDFIVMITTLVNNIYDIVNRSGVQMLIFLAGLQSISPAIYEACSIEGATAWETFWKITFPLISPMILVNAIYTLIDSFTSESNVVMSYVQSVYTTGREISTAMSWMYFLLIMAIIGVLGLIASAFVFYQKRD